MLILVYLLIWFDAKVYVCVCGSSTWQNVSYEYTQAHSPIVYMYIYKFIIDINTNVYKIKTYNYSKITL